MKGRRGIDVLDPWLLAIEGGVMLFYFICQHIPGSFTNKHVVVSWFFLYFSPVLLPCALAFFFWRGGKNLAQLLEELPRPDDILAKEKRYVNVLSNVHYLLCTAAILWALYKSIDFIQYLSMIPELRAFLVKY